jgi:hypothetical protein
MKNLKFLAVSLVLVMLLGSFGFAQMRNRSERSDMRDMMKKKLQLTDEQSKKIDQLRYNFQEKMIDLNAQLKKKELERKKMIAGDNFNRADLVNITKDIQDIRNNIGLEFVNHQMDVYDNLNGNQKQIFKDMILKMDRMKFKVKNQIRDKVRDRFDGRMRPGMMNQMDDQKPDNNQ